MKKILAIALALILIGAAAYAAIDLSGMSFDELLELRAQVDAALWASDGWTEAKVPAGKYLVGDDIPAGRWTITSATKYAVFVGIILPDGNYDESYSLSAGEYLNITATAGQTLEFSEPVIFTPYTSAALGFK